MNIILFDDLARTELLPMTFTRPIADIRVGITTLKEKWEFFLKEKTSFLTAAYLSEKFPIIVAEENVLVNAGIFANEQLAEDIKALKLGEALFNDEILVAIVLSKQELDNVLDNDEELYDPEKHTVYDYDEEIKKLNHVWEIFSMNGEQIKEDFENITKGRVSAEISVTNNILGKENIFVEEGVEMEFATINAKNGPVYIGKDAVVMEGAIIKAPFAICDHSTIKMGAKMYGDTTVGPHCKVGGEVQNTVFHSYSNKGHDGYLGNSVIGQWCNLGADTNCSNLKNTYDIVKIWNYQKKGFKSTGLQFCGLILGDHSKTAINTMFNTGTVVGVSSNLFGAGFPRVYIPSFFWGGASHSEKYNLKKAKKTATAVMKRRGIEFDAVEEKIFDVLYLIES